MAAKSLPILVRCAALTGTRGHGRFHAARSSRHSPATTASPSRIVPGDRMRAQMPPWPRMAL